MKQLRSGRSRKRSIGLGGLVAIATLATAAFPAASGAATFTFNNPTPIAVPGTGTGPAPGDPYPSTIDVSGLAGSITDVNVNFGATVHTNAEDMDVALVGPTGVPVFLMSDVCDLDDGALRPLAFDDSAATFLSFGGNCPSGTYLPTNDDGAPEAYFAPGPASQFNALSFFNGTNPNGTWNLFAQDDAAGSGGGSIGSWTLTLDGLEISQAPGASAPNPELVSCAGKPSTQLGTPEADVMVGTSGPDVISGIGGNDRISGMNGRDLICGGDGRDTLKGGKGKDILRGEKGRDILKGGKGNDRLKGGPGKDKEIQ